jgi:hypothetical protein
MILISLGAVAAFAVFAATTVTNAPSVGQTVIEGDMGLFPGTSFTGFPPGIVTGNTYPGGAYTKNAKIDAQRAYDDAAGKTADENLSNKDLGGLTLTPGVYKFDAAAAISEGELHLDPQADPNAVWVFQIVSALNIAGKTGVYFTNPLGKANNVYWQVGSSATINTEASFIGNVLAYSSISCFAEATVEGRLIALNGAVTLIDNAVSKPAQILPPLDTAASA